MKNDNPVAYLETIELLGPVNGIGQCFNRLCAGEACRGIVEKFGEPSPSECGYRGAAGHGFESHEAEWLLPAGRDNREGALPDEIAEFLVWQFANPLHLGMVKAWGNLAVEIFMVPLATSQDQWQSALPASINSQVSTFFWD